MICYLDDYPANVYPWLNLRSRGVTVRLLHPAETGELTPELVAEALTPKTRLVALASCNFVSGYRIDLNAIGKLLREKEVLFSVDAIQTLGAFPTTVEYVDFLSADAHKWMLGPLAIGIVYVRKECFDLCRPTLLGSWNVKAPGFVAQEEIEFHPTAQRYEPGAMNVMGIFGMKAAIDLLLEIGIAKSRCTDPDDHRPPGRAVCRNWDLHSLVRRPARTPRESSLSRAQEPIWRHYSNG